MSLSYPYSPMVLMELTEGARLLRWAVDPANENRAMTQADLARLLGVSAPTVHDWVRGAKRPRAERREAIRAVLAPYGVDLPVAAWLTSAERGEPSELEDVDRDQAAAWRLQDHDDES